VPDLLKTVPVALLLTLMLAMPATAHKIAVFASVEGGLITGYVYFPGGGRVREARVEFLAPDGNRLGEVACDSEGAFSFTPTAQVDHRVVAYSADSHVAEFPVAAADLPEDLAGTEPLEARFERAVARQVRPLREEMVACVERIRLRDVIGGLGYILGIAGIGFYVAARRARPRND